MNADQMIEKLHSLRDGGPVTLSDEDVCFLIRKLKAAEKLSDYAHKTVLILGEYELVDEPEDE